VLGPITSTVSPRPACVSLAITIPLRAMVARISRAVRPIVFATTAALRAMAATVLSSGEPVLECSGSPGALFLVPRCSRSTAGREKVDMLMPPPPRPPNVCHTAAPRGRWSRWRASRAEDAGA